jgi:NAD(P)-dependent dehydrogenase (short-subunit alcohol dehydrogenase family)
MRFKDKIAIVTGGTSGIGKEVATRFVAEGGSVVINGRDASKAEAAAREIDATGKRVAVHAGDIALPATSDAVVKTAISQFGHVDVLFNNAGIFAPKPFLEINEVEYDRFLDVILKGKFFAAQAAAKAMKASGRGGSRQDSRERDRTRGDRNTGIRHVPQIRAGGNCAGDLQRNAPAWPQRPAGGCSGSAAVSRLRSGEFHYRRRSPRRRRRYGRQAIVGGPRVRSSETRERKLRLTRPWIHIRMHRRCQRSPVYKDK